MRIIGERRSLFAKTSAALAFAPQFRRRRCRVVTTVSLPEASISRSESDRTQMPASCFTTVRASYTIGVFPGQQHG